MAEENKKEENILESKVEENKVEEKKEEKKSGFLNFIRNHPYLAATVGVLVGGYIGLQAISKTFSEASYAEVIEEKSTEKGDYTITVKMTEEWGGKTDERYCRFYISENKEMPVAVLADMIFGDPDGKDGLLKGSEIYIPNLTHSMPFSEPHSRYHIVCQGQIESNLVRVVHPWESSEAAQKSLENKIAEVKRAEIERAKAEIRIEMGGKYIF